MGDQNGTLLVKIAVPRETRMRPETEYSVKYRYGKGPDAATESRGRPGQRLGHGHDQLYDSSPGAFQTTTQVADIGTAHRGGRAGNAFVAGFRNRGNRWGADVTGRIAMERLTSRSVGMLTLPSCTVFPLLLWLR